MDDRESALYVLSWTLTRYAKNRSRPGDLDFVLSVYDEFHVGGGSHGKRSMLSEEKRGFRIKFNAPMDSTLKDLINGLWTRYSSVNARDEKKYRELLHDLKDSVEDPVKYAALANKHNPEVRLQTAINDTKKRSWFTDLMKAHLTETWPSDINVNDKED